MEDKALVSQEQITLGVLAVDGPAGVISRATAIAKQLAGIINSRKLYATISGKKYVTVEGWSTLGAMLGILPREKGVIAYEDGGFESTVELIRANDGMIVGGASAICGMDEPRWAKRPAYARRSMATTRATGKAFRLGFSWIMALAGYEPTPAEEMVIEAAIIKRASPKPKQPQTKAAPAVVVPHTDFPENPDIEALSLGDGSFQDAVIAEMPHYKDRYHITGALTKELGQGWGQRYSKSHLWEVLKARTETEMELEEGNDD